MKHISKTDIYDELDNIKTSDDLVVFLSHYPTRIHASVSFMLDGNSFKPAIDIYLDSTANIIIDH